MASISSSKVARSAYRTMFRRKPAELIQCVSNDGKKCSQDYKPALELGYRHSVGSSAVMSRRYDSAVTTAFSPEGRLYQVEHASEAIPHAETAQGIHSSQECVGIVLPAGRHVTNKILGSLVNEIGDHSKAGQTIALHSLCGSPGHRKNGFATIPLKDYISHIRDAGVVATRMYPPSQSDEKLYILNKAIVCTTADTNADVHILINYARSTAQQYRRTYNKEIVREQLVERLYDLKQSYAHHGGLRPFGISLIYAGYDKPRQFQLYQSKQPRINGGWKATSASTVGPSRLYSSSASQPKRKKARCSRGMSAVPITTPIDPMRQFPFPPQRPRRQVPRQIRVPPSQPPQVLLPRLYNPPPLPPTPLEQLPVQPEIDEAMRIDIPPVVQEFFNTFGAAGAVVRAGVQHEVGTVLRRRFAGEEDEYEIYVLEAVHRVISKLVSSKYGASALADDAAWMEEYGIDKQERNSIYVEEAARTLLDEWKQSELLAPLVGEVKAEYNYGDGRVNPLYGLAICLVRGGLLTHRPLRSFFAGTLAEDAAETTQETTEIIGDGKLDGAAANTSAADGGSRWIGRAR